MALPTDKKVIEAQVHMMNPGDIAKELIEWRASAPSIEKISKQLAEFRQFAKNADELTDKIYQLNAKWQAAVQFREEQLVEMVKLIESIQNDPIGASKHIDKMAALSLKRKLN